ncbi:MAG: hypothetical protein GC172_02610 [Phycisphaera sp.]|nr:hypothetical protein [Phycisphaera sp.]
MRPVDPTSALAALIAGNRRHLAQRGARAERGERQSLFAPSARPFALALAERSVAEVAASVFSTTERDIHVVDCPVEAGVRAAEHGVGLIVALQPVPMSVVEVEIKRRASEDAVFERLAAALRASTHLRRAILDGRVRAVAALLEEESQRVHWLGEHPQLAELLAESSGGAP